jgi:hypothetical protein
MEDTDGSNASLRISFGVSIEVGEVRFSPAGTQSEPSKISTITAAAHSFPYS